MVIVFGDGRWLLRVRWLWSGGGSDVVGVVVVVLLFS